MTKAPVFSDDTPSKRSNRLAIKARAKQSTEKMYVKEIIVIVANESD
eukprot:CAMPEP_0170812682 /NCGR_PEP_ID=MMETSP0733-20121128/36215_1 /TAXON_ID=186038 /ORGANISM="Fragilariopsis kerguelensis, Strain L26-C5" /LENGTH=46 /DNA_ID= /DNA_START= /DNA_END= /DNA_ORIENTATION=